MLLAIAVASGTAVAILGIIGQTESGEAQYTGEKCDLHCEGLCQNRKSVVVD